MPKEKWRIWLSFNKSWYQAWSVAIFKHKNSTKGSIHSLHRAVERAIDLGSHDDHSPNTARPVIKSMLSFIHELATSVVATMTTVSMWHGLFIEIEPRYMHQGLVASIVCLRGRACMQLMCVVPWLLWFRKRLRRLRGWLMANGVMCSTDRGCCCGNALHCYT